MEFEDVNVLTGQTVAAKSSAAGNVGVTVPSGKQIAGVYVRETWDYSIAQVTASGYGSNVFFTIYNPSDQVIHADTMLRVVFAPIAD